LQLLGADPEIDEKYNKCREECERLRKLIKEKENDQDEDFLKKYAQQAVPNVANLPRVSEGNNPRMPPYRFRVRNRMAGHFGKIYALHWGSNNCDIVSASQDGKLLVWNAQTCNKKIAIPLRSAWVMTCAYSPDLTYVASGGLDNLCTIFKVKDAIGWEVKQPHCELQQHEGYLSCCRFVNDEQIISASGDATCILWDIEKQQPSITFMGHTGDVESVAIFQEKSIFVSGAVDAIAKIWDYRSGKCVANYKGHGSDINSVAWFPDGEAFASGSDDATCRLFDMRSHRQINIFSGENIYSTVTSIDFSKSGYFLFAGYDEEPFCLAWNTITGKNESQLEHPTRASCLAVSDNGQAICTGCWDKQLRIWA